jgi:hypothetical protein
MRAIVVSIMSVIAVAGCQAKEKSMDIDQLRSFGARYAEAWCSQVPSSVAAFYEKDGSLTINGGDPSIGRAAITEAARGFMEAFPDLVVAMDEIGIEGDHAVFRWTLDGTSTGPGGSGNAVHISGYEEWTLSENGLIAESRGHFDEADYNRQLTPES